MFSRLSCLLLAALLLAASEPGYQAQIVNWRRNYETGLKKTMDGFPWPAFFG